MTSIFIKFYSYIFYTLDFIIIVYLFYTFTVIPTGSISPATNNNGRSFGILTLFCGLCINSNTSNNVSYPFNVNKKVQYLSFTYLCTISLSLLIQSFCVTTGSNFYCKSQMPFFLQIYFCNYLL